VPMEELDLVFEYSANGELRQGIVKYGSISNPDQPGDTDGDGDVDITDLNNVRNNFGSQGNPVVGDTSPFDGDVNITDLNNVRNNFGVVPGGASLGSWLPAARWRCWPWFAGSGSRRFLSSIPRGPRSFGFVGRFC